MLEWTNLKAVNHGACVIFYSVISSRSKSSIETFFWNQTDLQEQLFGKMFCKFLFEYSTSLREHKGEVYSRALSSCAHLFVDLMSANWSSIGLASGVPAVNYWKINCVKEVVWVCYFLLNVPFVAFFCAASLIIPTGRGFRPLTAADLVRSCGDILFQFPLFWVLNYYNCQLLTGLTRDKY